MDSRREPYRVGENHFLPYAVNYVNISEVECYLHCDVCLKFFHQNSSRVCMFLPNSETPKSYHPSCFWIAMKNGSNAIDADLVKGIDQFKYEDQEEFLRNLKEYNNSYEKAENVGRNMFNMTDGEIVQPVQAAASSTQIPAEQADVGFMNLLMSVAMRMTQRQNQNPENLETHNVVLVLSRMVVFLKQSTSAPFYEFHGIPKPINKCTECTNLIQDGELFFQMKDHAAATCHVSCAVPISTIIIGKVEECCGFSLLPPAEQHTFKHIFAERKTHLERCEKIRPVGLCEFDKTKKIVFLSTMKVSVSATFLQPCVFCNMLDASSSAFELSSEFNKSLCHTFCLFQCCSIIFETPESMIGYEGIPVQFKSLLRRQFDSGINHKVSIMTLANPEVIQRKRAFEAVEQEPGTSAMTEDVEEEEIQIEDAQTIELRKSQIYWSEILHQKFSKSTMTKVIKIIRHNKLGPVHIDSPHFVEWLVDIMMFGPPIPCPDCGFPTVFYHPDIRRYCCYSTRSSFSPCTFTSKNPIRGTFVLPHECNYLLQGLAGFYPNMFTERLYAGEAPESHGNRIARREFTFIKPFPQELLTDQQSFDLKYFSAVYEAIEVYFIKNGTAVPAYFSVIARKHQILTIGETVYQALLSRTDVQNNVNTLVEMFIVEHDLFNRFVLVESKSRTGTDFRQTSTKTFNEKYDAVQIFEKKFLELTSKVWANRREPYKIASKFFFVDVINNEVAESGRTQISKNVRFVLNDITTGPGGLLARAKSVQCQEPIFGQLSPIARQKALEVLNKLQKKIQQKAVTSWDCLDATNTFYTMVPTYSGFETHKLLDTKENIDKARERIKILPTVEPHELVNLYEAALNSLDLNMQVVPITSPEHGQIMNYMLTTIGGTHDIDVELLDVFLLERPSAQQKPIAENTMLLWHGSCKANIWSILQKGLQKPDPVRFGTMFGNGIYFADSFSKSVMYCRNGGACYVLLCEVALGTAKESQTAMKQDVVDANLALGYHSVKGVGLHIPAEATQLRLPDGLIVPMGPLVRQPNFNGSLLYNEYVVYDIDRVKLKYLCKVQVNRAAYRP